MSYGDKPPMELIGPGRKVTALARVVRVSGSWRAPTDGMALTLDDGREVHLDLSADCCSKSYYSDIKQFDELVGATIVDVEEREGPATTINDDGTPGKPIAKGESGDVMRWHFLVFTTDKGHVTIDWRNESNGYYDGSVEWSVAPLQKAKP